MAVYAYISFGSNLGDLPANFAAACEALARLPKVSLTRVSPLYLSEPLTKDGEEQPWYLNGAFEVFTELAPHDLMAGLKSIERKLGREERRKWAPRVADLDLLFYGDMIYADGNLRIPHPELHKRDFVLKPLCDLARELTHPEFDMTVGEMLAVSDDRLKVMPFGGTSEKEPARCS